MNANGADAAAASSGPAQRQSSLNGLNRPSSARPTHRNYANQNSYSNAMGATPAQFYQLDPSANNSTGSSQNRTNMLQAYGEENPLFYERLVQILGKAAADEMVKEAVDETIKEEADNNNGNDTDSGGQGEEEVAVEPEGVSAAAGAAGQRQQANMMQGSMVQTRGDSRQRNNEQDVICLDDTSDEDDTTNLIQQQQIVQQLLQQQPQPQLVHVPSPSKSSPKKNTAPFVAPTARAHVSGETRAATHTALIARANAALGAPATATTSASFHPPPQAVAPRARVAQVVTGGGRPRTLGVPFSPLKSTLKTAGAAAAAAVQQSNKRKADGLLLPPAERNPLLPPPKRAESLARVRAMAEAAAARGTTTSVDLTENSSQPSVPNPLVPNPLNGEQMRSLYARPLNTASALSNYARKRTAELSALNSVVPRLDKGLPRVAPLPVIATTKVATAMASSTATARTPHAITAAIAAAQGGDNAGDSIDDNPPGFDQFKADPEFCKLIFDAAEKHKNNDSTKEEMKSVGGVFVRGLLNIKDSMLNKSLIDDSERSFRDYVRDVISPYFSIPPNLAESEGQWEAYVHVSSDNINEFARNVVYQRRKSMKSAVELAFYELRDSKHNRQSEKTDDGNSNAVNEKKEPTKTATPSNSVNKDHEKEKDLKIKKLEEELHVTKLQHAKQMSAMKDRHLDETKDCESNYTKFVSKVIKSHRKEVNDLRKDMKTMNNVHATFLESYAEASLEELRNNCESPSL